MAGQQQWYASEPEYENFRFPIVKEAKAEYAKLQ
jgi:hypothetical protein